MGQSANGVHELGLDTSSASLRVAAGASFGSPSSPASVYTVSATAAKVYMETAPASCIFSLTTVKCRARRPSMGKAALQVLADRGAEAHVRLPWLGQELPCPPR